MSDFWWLQCCAKCGTNIWKSGGDQDWGLCFDCLEQQSESEERERDRVMCDTTNGCTSMCEVGGRER